MPIKNVLLSGLADKASAEIVYKSDGELKKAAKRVKAHLSRAGTSIFEAGQILLDVKSSIGHGRFSDWVVAELQCSQRTAQHLMAIAKVFADKYENFAHLPQSTLLMVASRSTSLECRTRIFDEATSEKSIDVNFIEEEVKKDRIGRRERMISAEKLNKQPDAGKPSVTNDVIDEEKSIFLEIRRAANEIIQSGQAREIPSLKIIPTDAESALVLKRVAETIVKRLPPSRVLGFISDIGYLKFRELSEALSAAHADHCRAISIENRKNNYGRPKLGSA